MGRSSLLHGHFHPLLVNLVKVIHLVHVEQMSDLLRQLVGHRQEISCKALRTSEAEVEGVVAPGVIFICASAWIFGESTLERSKASRWYSSSVDCFSRPLASAA